MESVTALSSQLSAPQIQGPTDRIARVTFPPGHSSSGSPPLPLSPSESPPLPFSPSPQAGH